jgi:hypothetical protein
MKSISDTAQVYERLQEFYVGLEEESWTLRLARDPLRPPTKDGRIELNPVFICTGVIAILTWTTFIFFSFGV